VGRHRILDRHGHGFRDRDGHGELHCDRYGNRDGDQQRNGVVYIHGIFHRYGERLGHLKKQ